MTYDQYFEQMNRLVSQFGKGAYSTERSAVIWREVQHQSPEWWERTVNKFLGECRQAPLLPEIREALSRDRERGQSNVVPIGSAWTAPYVAKCDFCFDIGVYICRSKLRPGDWAFRCHCSKGTSDPRKAIPQFKQGHADEFYYSNAKPTIDMVRE